MSPTTNAVKLSGASATTPTVMSRSVSMPTTR